MNSCDRSTWSEAIGRDWWGNFYEAHPGPADFAQGIMKLRETFRWFFTNGEFVEQFDLYVPEIQTTDSQGDTITSPAVEEWRIHVGRRERSLSHVHQPNGFTSAFEHFHHAPRLWND